MKRGRAAAVFFAVAAGAGLAAWRFGSSVRAPEPAPPAVMQPTPALAPAAPPPAAATAQTGTANEGDGLRRVPVPPVDTRTPAWLSLAQARESGDPRTPPVQRGAAAERPDASLLADHDAYAAYELAQKQRMAAAYVQAAAPELASLRADVERGREAGIPPEELARVEEKIRRIEQQRQAADALLAKGKQP